MTARPCSFIASGVVMKLTVQDVSVTYGSTVAVHDVRWNLEEGVHALLGPNGAGKSTLLETIATLRKPQNGNITLGDAEGLHIRRHLGYLPQDNLPRTRFRVREHLAYMCWLKELPPKDYDCEVDRVLDVCRLSSYSDVRISQLSGGLRRRVAIGSSLIGSPHLVLLDEASSGLDVEQRDILQGIVETISREAIVITSTHIVEDIVDVADTITIMAKGEFIFSDRTEEFCAQRSLDSVKQHYLELVNV